MREIDPDNDVFCKLRYIDPQHGAVDVTLNVKDENEYSRLQQAFMGGFPDGFKSDFFTLPPNMARNVTLVILVRLNPKGSRVRDLVKNSERMQSL